MKLNVLKIHNANYIIFLLGLFSNMLKTAIVIKINQRIESLLNSAITNTKKM
jgi:hypothetical protein